MPPAQFFREIFEIRGLIEPQAAALAAERATKADIAEMRGRLRGHGGRRAARQAPAIEADLRFHRAILAGAHNDLLLQMGNLIGVGLMVSYRLSSDSFAVFLPLHKDVLDAVAARDAEARARRHGAAPRPTRGRFSTRGSARPRRRATARAKDNAKARAAERRPDQERIRPELQRSGAASKGARMAEDFPSFDLSGQVVLVTAAARGLGRACALACAHAGADIALGLRDKESGEALAEEIEAMGRRALPLQMDMEQLDEIRGAIAEAHAHFGKHRRARQQCRRQPGKPRRGRAGGGLRLHGAGQSEGHVLRQPGGRAG